MASRIAMNRLLPRTCSLLRSQLVGRTFNPNIAKINRQSIRALSSSPSSTSKQSWTHAENRNELDCVEWPVSRMNTILNVCPQGERVIVERFGAFQREVQPGLFVAIPGIDNLAFCVDMRERTLAYPPQLAITKDNVSVKVSAVLFVQFEDAIKACYGASNPLLSVLELAKSAMRSKVGELELDELFHGRAVVNDAVCGAVQSAASKWGLKVTRHEILDVRTDDHIAQAMDRQAAAERVRREQVLQAEGAKERARLESEGQRIRAENESEGEFVRARNEAKAKAIAFKMQADAMAESLRTISQAVSESNGREAARLLLARDYINMYGEMGKNSNTIMMGNKHGDIDTVLARAALSVDAVRKEE